MVHGGVATALQPRGRQNSNWAQSPRKALSGAALRGHFPPPAFRGRHVVRMVNILPPEFVIQVVGEQLEPVNPQTERDRCGTSLICSTTVDQMNGCWFSLVLKRHRDEQQTKTYAHTGWKHLYFKLAYARRPAMANNVGAPAAWICTRHSFKSTNLYPCGVTGAKRRTSFLHCTNSLWMQNLLIVITVDIRNHKAQQALAANKLFPR